MKAQTCCYLMIIIKFMKFFIFLCFYERINFKLNHFSSISKNSNFRVLQFYPLKMNLNPEIRKTSTRRQGYPVFGFFFTSSCSSIVLIRIPRYFAYLLTLLQVTELWAHHASAAKVYFAYLSTSCSQIVGISVIIYLL